VIFLKNDFRCSRWPSFFIFWAAVHTDRHRCVRHGPTVLWKITVVHSYIKFIWANTLSSVHTPSISTYQVMSYRITSQRWGHSTCVGYPHVVLIEGIRAEVKASLWLSVPWGTHICPTCVWPWWRLRAVHRYGGMFLVSARWPSARWDQEHSSIVMCYPKTSPGPHTCGENA
jgi:hypothetical protein